MFDPETSCTAGKRATTIPLQLGYIHCQPKEKLCLLHGPTLS